MNCHLVLGGVSVEAGSGKELFRELPPCVRGDSVLKPAVSVDCPDN